MSTKKYEHQNISSLSLKKTLTFVVDHDGATIKVFGPSFALFGEALIVFVFEFDLLWRFRGGVGSQKGKVRVGSLDRWHGHTRAILR